MLKVTGLERYFGGKNGSGTPQQLINLQPVHSGYAALFLGSGGEFKRKKPAQVNLGVDLNPQVIQLWNNAAPTFPNNVTWSFQVGNAIEFLKSLIGVTHFMGIPIEQWLIYLDPPYPAETYRGLFNSQYDFELTPSGHDELLQLIIQLKCMIQISTSPNLKYDTWLSKWNKHEFRSMTRRGPQNELLYYNYPKPTLLHDSKFTGKNYRERERIKNRVERNTSRLLEMEATERNAILVNILKNPALLTPEIKQLIANSTL